MRAWPTRSRIPQLAASGQNCRRRRERGHRLLPRLVASRQMALTGLEMVVIMAKTVAEVLPAMMQPPAPVATLMAMPMLLLL